MHEMRSLGCDQAMAVVEVMGKLERGWLKRDKENDGLSRSRESVEA